ncbi:hypothetical protein PMAYCL1PPCAC_20703, partial [Pristionchus mayeri]
MEDADSIIPIENDMSGIDDDPDELKINTQSPEEVANRFDELQSDSGAEEKLKKRKKEKKKKDKKEKREKKYRDQENID